MQLLWQEGRRTHKERIERFHKDNMVHGTEAHRLWELRASKG